MARLRSLLLLALLLGTWARPLKDPKVVELNAASFDAELRQLAPDTMALIEFFASWCPACRRFEPEYEKIGAYFKHSNDIKPAVYVARVDCAEQVALCGEFKMTGYPSIFLGRPDAFTAHNGDNVTEYPHEHKRAPADIVSWVAQQLSADYKYEEQSERDAPPEVSELVPTPSAPYQFEMADVERATVELMTQATLGLEGPTKRTALLTLVEVFGSAHPSPRCEAGALKLKDSYSRLWPDGTEQPTEELLHFPICGDDAKEVQWVACNDNDTNTRGFTCGVWLLFHSMAVRYPDSAEAGKHIMAALNAFSRNFFKCEECAEHFTAMLDEPEAAGVVSKRDAVLWIWRSHNKVNGRLAKEEEADEDDSEPGAVPKVQWPTADVCPSCRVPSLKAEEHNITWADDEVYSFLLRFYGSTQTAPTAQPTAIEAESRLPQGPATTVGQFVRSTLLFLAALLGVWYMASLALKKHKPLYHRNWM